MIDEASQRYLERYRRLRMEMSELAKEAEEVKRTAELRMQQVRDARFRMHQELSHMQKVITKMIDDGTDSVEAQLKADDRMRNMWDMGFDEPLGGFTVSGAIGAMGPTGAIGAMGSIGSSGSMLMSAGANGMHWTDDYSDGQ